MHFQQYSLLDYKEEIKEEEEVEHTKETKQKEKKKKDEEEKIKIVAALIMRVIHKYDYSRVFSRVQLVEGEAMKKCITFKNFVNRKVDVFAKFNCDSILRYYDLCILPEYQHRGYSFSLFVYIVNFSYKSYSLGLGLILAKCGLYVAKAMNVPVVMGVFSDFRVQKLAKKIGMEVIIRL